MTARKKAGSISPERIEAFRRAAESVRPFGYSPYSGFLVLAAAETSVGVFGGANVEAVNFSLTKHAEEVAILAAQMAGAGREKPKWLRALYIAGASPCGSCRQFASEFGTDDTIVVLDRINQEQLRNERLTGMSPHSIEVRTLGELLPDVFEAKELTN